MRYGMFVREAIASVLSTALFFVLALLGPLVLEAPGQDSSSHRGALALPVLFALAVPIVWASGRYLLSKGLHTPMRFSFGAFALTSGLFLVGALPAVVIGSVVGLFSWASAISFTFVASLYASVVSVPAYLVWWWFVAHNLRFKPPATPPAWPAA